MHLWHAFAYFHALICLARGLAGVSSRGVRSPRSVKVARARGARGSTWSQVLTVWLKHQLQS